MRRMQSKQRGYDGAWPGSFGDSMKQQKKQKSVADMEEEIYDVLFLRVQAEQLDVQHVG